MKKLPLLLMLATPWLGAAQAQPAAPGADSAPLLSTALPARTQATADDLRERLKITPEQAPLWTAYVARLDSYTQQFYRERPALATEQEPAPQQIMRMVMNQQNRLAGLEDIEQAAKALYAQLNADQQKVANLWLLASIPTFNGVAPAGTGGSERRPDMRQGNDMRRGGGRGMGGMGSARF